MDPVTQAPAVTQSPAVDTSSSSTAEPVDRVALSIARRRKRRGEGPATSRAAANPALRELCFLDYVLAEKLEDIARKRGVPVDTVTSWHFRFKWKDRRHALLDKLSANNEAALMLMAQDESLGFARDQIQSIRRLQEQVTTHLGPRGDLTKKLTADEMHDVARVVKILSDAGGPLFMPKSMQSGNKSRVPPLSVNVLVGNARDRIQISLSDPSALATSRERPGLEP